MESKKVYTPNLFRRSGKNYANDLNVTMQLHKMKKGGKLYMYTPDGIKIFKYEGFYKQKKKD